MKQEIKNVLDKLENERVVSIDDNGDGTATFAENCDYWFACTLSNKELGYLIEYLESIHQNNNY